MKKIIGLAFALLLLSPMHAATTYALSCVELPSVDKAYERYDGIIVGKVDEVSRHDDRHEAKLTVSKSYKGVDKQNISIDEDMTWGALNGPSEVGQQYLFFLNKKDGGWENPLCAPTVKIADASEQLAFLKDKEIALDYETAPAEMPSNGSGKADDHAADDQAADNTAIAETDDASSRWTVILIIVIAAAAGAIAYGFVRKRG
ncbi:hypothetical protein [Paenibacillus plantiphilus]|nr:hypothetical protein [Paenibacillus plantiphilus]